MNICVFQYGLLEYSILLCVMWKLIVLMNECYFAIEKEIETNN